MLPNEINETQRMLVFGLPKLLTPLKLKKLIGRQIAMGDLWELEMLVPLEAESMAQIVCDNSETYEKLAETILHLGKYKTNFAEDSISLCRLPNRCTEPQYFNNRDCLRQIFEWCPLKTQITLAKVCRLYHELIESIWRVKYKTLRYDLKDWHCKEQLTRAEVCDFLTVVGEFVVHLIFWCFVYIPVYDVYHMDHMVGNFLSISKQLINRLMCRDLAYFPNLHIFEVEGKFLFDWVIRSLALHCTQLRVFRLLDCESRWLSGAHFWRLRNLRECSLNNAKTLQRRLVAKLCRHAQHLRTLDLVQCERLQESQPREMLLLCREMRHLETLRLSVPQNDEVLCAILRLSALKRLQFYWDDNAAFEARLLPLLQQLERYPCRLKFEQEPVYMENATQMRNTVKQEAEMREKVALLAPLWQFGEEVLRILYDFSTLNEIRCVYCRPLSVAQMLELPMRCVNLKNIELLGCRDAVEDNSLERLWPVPLLRQKCRLRIDGILTVEEMQRLKDSTKLAGRSGRVLRSIECCFT